MLDGARDDAVREPGEDSRGEELPAPESHAVRAPAALQDVLLREVAFCVLERAELDRHAHADTEQRGQCALCGEGWRKGAVSARRGT